MNKKLDKGLFISFEGAEGSGKSTQATLLADFLAGEGYDVVFTREPGAGEIGNKIRKIILDPENSNLCDKAEAFLYASDRAQHVESLLRPSLEAGKIVICDRYVDSNMAYQGYGRGLSVEFLEEINKLATGGLMPDLTILLDVDAEEGLNRARARGAYDRIEQESLDFHKRLVEGYHEIERKAPERVVKVDGVGEVLDINERVKAVVLTKLNQMKFED